MKSNFFISVFIVIVTTCTSSFAGSPQQQPDPMRLLIGHLMDPNLNTPPAAITNQQKSSNENQNSLRNALYSSPDSQTNPEKRQQLLNLLEQLRSIEFEKSLNTPKPVAADTAKQPQIPKNQEKHYQQPKTEEKQLQPEPNNPPDTNTLSKETLKLIDNLCKNPQRVKNPFELAEILYLGGFPKQASVFYQQHINRISTDNKTDAAEKAWVMFQAANCLREENSSAAAELYKKMIVEFPNCPWADLAKVRLRLLKFYQKESPQTLLKNAEKK